MDLMAADGKQVHAHPSDINRDLAVSLHRVCMKNDSGVKGFLTELIMKEAAGPAEETHLPERASTFLPESGPEGSYIQSFPLPCPYR